MVRNLRRFTTIELKDILSKEGLLQRFISPIVKHTFYNSFKAATHKEHFSLISLENFPFHVSQTSYRELTNESRRSPKAIHGETW